MKQSTMFRPSRTPLLSITILLIDGYQQGYAFFHAVNNNHKPSFFPSRTSDSRSHVTPLYGGVGTATNYSWVEEPFELEIHITVPEGTRAKDISFQALPRSIDMRLLQEDGPELVLLDAKRFMRGRVSTDGTFWEIHDVPDSKKRQITVQIEKNHRTPKDDFDIVDYDWGGVYPKDDEEVISRKYEQPEELNIREYAASLGVDIDNINMSLVDKTMFSSGLNMTRSTVDQLAQKGLVQEVTRQGDGQEFITNEDGEKLPFSPFDSIMSKKIPFIDTPLPRTKNATIKDLDMKGGVATVVEDGVEPLPDDEDNDDGKPDVKTATDPIDMLTVKRMKDILKKQGLKVSGNKEELKDRLRSHVQSMIGNSGGTAEDDSAIIDI